MIWVPVAAIGFLLLLAPCILAIGAWVRAQDAQERLRIAERRIAELEAHAGLARPRAAVAAPTARAAAARGAGAALEERIALVWFSRIGVAVMLLGACWFFFSPVDSAGGRVARALVGAVAGLAALALAELGRERTRGVYNQVLLAMGVALLAAAAFASRSYGIVAPGAALALVAAVAALAAGVAARHRAEPPLVVATAAALAAPLLARAGAPHLVAVPWTVVAVGGLGLAAARLAMPWAVALGVAGAGGLLALWTGTSYAGAPGERAALLLASVALLALWTAAQRLARARDAASDWPTALLVAALSLAHLGVGAAVGGYPATLALAFAALGVAGAAALRRDGRPLLLGVPLAVAALVLAAPAVQLATARLVTTAALVAWAAVHAAAFLRPSGGRAPSRVALALAAAAASLFLLIDGGVLAPHLPAAFAVVVALHGASQVALARRGGGVALLAPAVLLGAGGLAGAAAHGAGSTSPLFLAAAAAWALAFAADAAERTRRGEPRWPELTAAAVASAAFALAAAIVVPSAAAALRGALVALAAGAPLALGLALRQRRERAAAALLSTGLALVGGGILAALGSAAATVAWAAGATALVVGGFAIRSALARRLGLGVFAAALLKLAAWDVWRLARGYQVGVLVAVGGLLLAASYLYARRGARAGAAPTQAIPPAA
jgi:Predicted membrane protein (DUF2339)